MTWCWIDGEVVPAELARVSALDHGLTVGDGVFETLKVVDGVPFAWTRHVRRLHRSAAALELTVPLDDGHLRAAADAAIGACAAAGEVPGRLRLTVTGGPGPLGSDRGEVPPTVLALASPSAPWPVTTSVVTVPWVRNERSAVAGAKTTSYAENVRALAVAHRAGASEALFANTVGALCEGTGSNVFLALEGRLVTPALSSGCLAGITRELVLEVVEVVEVDDPAALSIDDLGRADEVFLTSSTRDVHPVVTVDGRPVGDGVTVGPLTRAAQAAFAALEARTLDP